MTWLFHCLSFACLFARLLSLLGCRTGDKHRLEIGRNGHSLGLWCERTGIFVWAGGVVATAKADKIQAQLSWSHLDLVTVQRGAGVAITSAIVMVGWWAHGPCKEVWMITGTAQEVFSRPGLVRSAAMADSDRRATLVGGWLLPACMEHSDWHAQVPETLLTTRFPSRTQPVVSGCSVLERRTCKPQENIATEGRQLVRDARSRAWLGGNPHDLQTAK